MSSIKVLFKEARVGCESQEARGWKRWQLQTSEGMARNDQSRENFEEEATGDKGNQSGPEECNGRPETLALLENGKDRQ